MNERDHITLERVKEVVVFFVSFGCITSIILHCFFLPVGHYMYIETSWPRKAGDKARLRTPVIKSESKDCSLRFYYHMKGDDIGSLVVYIRKSYNDFNSLISVLNISGQQVWYLILKLLLVT